MELNKQIRHPIITLLKNIDLGVLMGHTKQLPWTGLIQWGNDGTHLLIRDFAIFLETSHNFPSSLEKRRLTII